MRICLLIAMLFFGSLGSAQQLPHYTQFDRSRFLIDPAVAGSKPYYRVRLHGRQQWRGFPGAPRTGVLSIEGPLQRGKMGIGGYFFKDEAGPAERTGGQLAYSYRFRVDESKRIALGLGAGVLQYRIANEELVLYDPDDPAFQGDEMSTIEPDASFGAYFYGRRFGIGISGFQLLHNELRGIGTNTRLDGHYFLHAFYETPLSEKLDLRPFMLVKYAHPSDPQFELGARAIYKDMIWLGVNYRSRDAIAGMAGYSLNQKWSIGYSYDMTLSELQGYQGGSHEIVLGYRFHPGTGSDKKEEKEEEKEDQLKKRSSSPEEETEEDAEEEKEENEGPDEEDG